MRHVDDGRLIHLEDRVVDLEPAVGRRRATLYQLGDVDGSIVADMGVVGAAGDAKAEARTAPLEDDLLVLPLVIAVHLKQENNSLSNERF